MPTIPFTRRWRWYNFPKSPARLDGHFSVTSEKQSRHPFSQKRTGPVHFSEGGGGGTHIFGTFCPNPECTARIPASAENLAERGVGESDTLALFFLFFLPRPNLFYFGIGLGIHEILQVIPVKIIDTRKEEKKRIFTEFPTSFARICPNSPQV